MADYFKEGSEAISNLAKEVIKKYHPKLANINIAYRFRDKAKESKGRIVYSEVKKPSKLYKTFIDADVIVIVPEDKWSAADQVKRQAMLDDAFCTIKLEADENTLGFPRKLEAELYLLSDGRKIQGKRKAINKQNEITDYDIKIVDHQVKANVKNVDRFGTWRKDLNKMQQQFTQTEMNFPRAVSK